MAASVQHLEYAPVFEATLVTDVRHVRKCDPSKPTIVVSYMFLYSKLILLI